MIMAGGAGSLYLAAISSGSLVVLSITTATLDISISLIFFLPDERIPNHP
jgi:hypothetical protein